MNRKAKELKLLSKDELAKKLEEVQMNLVKANAQIATGTAPKSPGQVRVYKKTIARIKSLVNPTESKKA